MFGEKDEGRNLFLPEAYAERSEAAKGKPSRIESVPGVLLLLKLIVLYLLVIPQTIIALIKYYFFTELEPIEGKVVLLTGTASGLGRQLAKEFADHGCKVACVDFDEAGNKQTVDELNEKYPGCCKAYRANITKIKDIEELAKQVEVDWARIDILVNNAAIVTPTNLLEDSDEEIEAIIQVNLLGHFRMVRQFLPGMIERNSGHIVAICSVTAFGSAENLSAYVASKYGVLGFMKCLAEDVKEIANNRIKLTTVCPYFIDTNPIYNNHWKLSIPALSVQSTAKEIINGIQKNESLFTIPKNLYYLVGIVRLCPQATNNLFRDIINFKILNSTKDEKATLPASKIIGDTLENKSTS